MIPKIIHLCWLSGDPFPFDIVKCLETWNCRLKEYTIWLWGKIPCDEESMKCLNNLNVKELRFDLDSTIWTRQAFKAKKYAFAADYIRLYALYNYGGIYLDADVLVYKSFDELLHMPYFIGCDQIRAFEAAVIGAEKGCKWIKNILETYRDKEFVKQDGSYDMLELPVRFQQILTELRYKFIKVNNIKEFRNYPNDEKILNVFAKDFFNSRNSVEVHRTNKSFCAHNYAGSWQKKKEQTSFSDNIKNKMPKWMLKFIYEIGQKTWSKNKYSWFQIPFEK